MPGKVKIPAKPIGPHGIPGMVSSKVDSYRLLPTFKQTTPNANQSHASVATRLIIADVDYDSSSNVSAAYPVALDLTQVSAASVADANPCCRQ